MKPEGEISTEAEVEQLLSRVTARSAQAPRMAYSRKEAAVQLSVSKRTIDRLIAARKIRVRKLWGRTIIPAAELAKLLRQDTYFTAARRTRASLKSIDAETA
jgi:excisionase family DNA binding protein